MKCSANFFLWRSYSSFCCVFLEMSSSSGPKRIRVSGFVLPSPYQDTDNISEPPAPSTIRLRPRPSTATPPTRRSYRIVSRASESAPSIIRVTREPSLTTSLDAMAFSTPPSNILPEADSPSEPTEEEPDSVSSLSSVDEPEIIDLDAQPTPAPQQQQPPSPMSLSSRDSYESTLSSGSSWDTEEEDEGEAMANITDPYGSDYLQFVSQLVRQNSLGEQRVRGLVSAPPIAETSADRPELIEILKYHSGRCTCMVCHNTIVSNDTCVDFRPRTRAGLIKHCHFGCIEGTPLYFPPDERLIRFDPQISERDRTSFLNQLRERLPDSANPTVPLHPLVRPGDPDRRIQRQRDFINQELARVRREQEDARRALESRRYLDSRRELYARFGGQYAPSPSAPYLPRPFTMPVPGPPIRGLPRGVLYSLPRMSVPSSSVPTPEESDDGKETHCVICLEEMVAGEEILILPCFHKFHSKCIESWFDNSRLCPIDKLDIEQLYHRTGNSQDIPPFLLETPAFRGHTS